jgi:hypothetical protein
MTPEHPAVALARELVAAADAFDESRTAKTQDNLATALNASRDGGNIVATARHLILLQAVASAARDRIESHGQYGECLCSLCAAFHKLDAAPGQGV